MIGLALFFLWESLLFRECLSNIVYPLIVINDGNVTFGQRDCACI